jgi:hypothetical protein
MAAPKGHKRWGGRKKGTTNKLNAEVKALVEGALAELGGQKWLVSAAKEHPQAFMTLVGKLIPRDLNVNATHKYESLSDADIDKRIAELSAAVGALGAADRTQATH